MKDSNDKDGNHPVPPPGAIQWSDLSRYLSAVAYKQFRHIAHEDIDQYVLLIVFNVTNGSANDYTTDLFWESLSSASSKGDFCFLPDTEAGYLYFANCPDRSLLVRKVKDIKAFFRKAFFNLVISDFRKNQKQEQIRERLLVQASSTRFRRTVSNHCALDAFADDLEQQRLRTDLHCALIVINKMYKSMDPYDSLIFDLFLQRYNQKEIAKITQKSGADVSSVIRSCKRKFQSLWRRIDTSQQ